MLRRDSIQFALAHCLRSVPAAPWALLLFVVCFQVAVPLQLAAINTSTVYQEPEEDSEPAEAEGQQDLPELYAPSGRLRRSETQLAERMTSDRSHSRCTRASAPAFAEHIGRNGIGGPLRC